MSAEVKLFSSAASGMTLDWLSASIEKKPVVLNDCRELVLVPGGISEKIRNLTEERPDICWQYVGSSVLAHYHFNVAAVDRDAARAVPQKKNATLPVFYAQIHHSFSPVEFAVQPKPFTKARLALTAQLNDVYSDDFEPFKEEEIFEGVPCAVKDSRDGKWYRARLVSGRPGVHNDVFVVFVDWGDERCVSGSNIRPLRKEFGRLPPLALICRMRGIMLDDLFTKKVEEFQKLIASINGLVRVELTSTAEPYLVNLYHPTIAGWNLGTSFYPRPMNEQQIAKEERIARQGKEPDPDDENYNKYDVCYSDDDEDEPVVRRLPAHLLRFERLPKPIAQPGEELRIAHVENARLIYVHTADHLAWLTRSEKEMAERWESMDRFPDRALIADNACALKTTDGAVVRAMIVKGTSQSVTVRAVDHGWKVVIKREQCRNYLRALPREFGPHLMVWLLRLPDSCDNHPHVGETAILRELLPRGQKIAFELARRSHGPPFKASLFVGDDKRNVLDLMEERKKELRVVHPCKEIVKYSQRQVELLRATNGADDYDEELFCPPAFAKGRALYCNHST
uniref:Tudor domain-containing protein n=1 Tax=Plectus sambesii TaxID=2011161 RepID=A0A914W5H2_9BILA